MTRPVILWNDSPETVERLRGRLAERYESRTAAHRREFQLACEVAEFAGAHRIVGRKVAQLFRHGHRLLRDLHKVFEGRASSQGGVS